MFKLRKKIFPSRGYKTCDRIYQDFLLKNKKYIDEDFYKMFSYDYFHDGGLSKISMNISQGELIIELDCPNYINNRNEFVDVDFALNFSEISYFCLEPEYSAFTQDLILDNSIFLCAEIGTLTSPRRAQSIIMKCLSDSSNRIFYLSLVFKKIKINPKEPLALKMLEHIERIHLE